MKISKTLRETSKQRTSNKRKKFIWLWNVHRAVFVCSQVNFTAFAIFTDTAIVCWSDDNDDDADDQQVVE